MFVFEEEFFDRWWYSVAMLKTLNSVWIMIFSCWTWLQWVS